MSDFQERDDDVIRCPECGGEARLMGFLGNTAWFRCRQCGMESSHPAEDGAVTSAPGKNEED